MALADFTSRSSAAGTAQQDKANLPVQVIKAALLLFQKKPHRLFAQLAPRFKLTFPILLLPSRL
jgi:hypothetical protein